MALMEIANEGWNSAISLEAVVLLCWIVGLILLAIGISVLIAKLVGLIDEKKKYYRSLIKKQEEYKNEKFPN